MTFPFVERIGSLDTATKALYYLFLLQELTIVTRAIWSDEQLTTLEQLDQIKWVNEVMHRVLNRVIDLQLGHGTWTEEDMWAIIRTTAAQNHHIGGFIGAAMEHTYTRLLQIKERQNTPLDNRL